MNGKGRKCYNVIRLSFEELNGYLEKELDYAGHVALTTTSIDEIKDFMEQDESHKGRKRIADDYSVEIYEIDEDGEFLDGSDFDSMKRFLEVNGR